MGTRCSRVDIEAGTPEFDFTLTHALRNTAGRNDEVFDALLLIAAGSWEHEALRQGSRRLTQLMHDMDEGRRKRLLRLGFSENEAAELSALHTRNFM